MPRVERPPPSMWLPHPMLVPLVAVQHNSGKDAPGSTSSRHLCFTATSSCHIALTFLPSHFFPAGVWVSFAFNVHAVTSCSGQCQCMSAARECEQDLHPQCMACEWKNCIARLSHSQNRSLAVDTKSKLPSGTAWTGCLSTSILMNHFWSH